MKKTRKKIEDMAINSEVVSEMVTTNEKSMKFIKLFHLGLLGIVVLGSFVAYTRYWNVATVNGKGIPRIQYINTIEKQVGKQALEQMIQESLILQEATNKKFVVDQKDVDTQIATIEAQIKSQGQTLDAALKAEGMVKSDLEKQIRLQKIVEGLSKTTTEISQQQIDDFLAKNSAQLPKGSTKEELQKLAKDQLVSQAESSAVSTWLEKLKTEAKIIYQ